MFALCGNGLWEMFLLVAFLYVVPPIGLGEFATREACEQELAALIATIADNLATMRGRLVSQAGARSMPKAGHDPSQ